MRAFACAGRMLGCVLTGHDDWVRREPGRLLLECVQCGRTTPGWDLANTRTHGQRHDLDRGRRGGRMPNAFDAGLWRVASGARTRLLDVVQRRRPRMART